MSTETQTAVEPTRVPAMTEKMKAAVPDLIEALKETRQALEKLWLVSQTGDYADALWNKIDQALKKAELK